MSTPEAELAPRLFQCSTCSRSFTRADHLTRHVRAHTRHKPYICPTCSKGFSRIDLLKRHAAAHDNPPDGVRKRRESARQSRVVQACEACSQHHLRCEDEKPCSRCRKKNIHCKTSAVCDKAMDDVHAAQDLLDFSNTSASMHLGSQRQTNDPEILDDANSAASTTMQRQSTYATPEGLQTTTRGGPRSSDVNFQQYHVEPMAQDMFPQEHLPSFDDMTVLDEELPDHLRSLPPFGNGLSGIATPRGIMDTSFNWDLSLNDLDVAFLDQYNMDIPFNVETPVTDPSSTDRRASTHPHEGVDVRHEAFKRSIWRYLPRSDRDFGTAEEQNLALADGEGNAERRAQLSSRRAIQERLSRTARDKLFALVLGTCTSSNRGRISSAFPSTELLDGLIQYFLTSPSLDSKFWFHLPTFSPSEISPILLSLIIAAGAVSTPDVPLRKLGFALHEAGRACQAKIFEEDNSSIRDLQSLRNLMLQLDIGLWSGMSRKMEIAESFLQPLVTMIRRRGSFRNSMYPMIEPRPEDDGQELDDKWKSWVAQESLLRLVYHVFEHDRQSSMALLKPPLISYSEMQLPIPSAERLWRANTAIAWKQAYLDMAPELLKRPSPLECLLDLNCLNNHEVANRTYLYMIWGMIWEFRQMATINAKTGSSHRNGLILPSRYQDLNKSLEDYRISCPTREGSIILELMFIHLNAPLEDIILFAGIEGQGEARNAYPCLREWVSSPPARQALWHAGQILRAARALPKGGLCNFNAISVYHAGLIIWGYSFVNRSAAHMTSGTSVEDTQMVLLDEDYTLDVRRFITLDRGSPAIRSLQTRGNPIAITDIDGVMSSLVKLFQANHDTAGSSPPLVDNLVQLIEGLRFATES